MKKHILSLTLIFISCLAVAQSKNMVVIKGTLNGDLKGHNKIYMYTRTSNDSAKIKDGRYSFSFPFSEVSIQMLYPSYVKEMHQMYQPFGILISEPGTYYIVSDIVKGMNASVLSGPEPMLVYKQFNDEHAAAYKTINNALAAIYGKDWYMISEKDGRYGNFQNSSDSLKNIILVPLIENLVRKYPDSYATAFVLAGIGKQIGSVEKKEQWLEMVSSRIRNSEQVKKLADYIQGLKSSGIGNTVASFILPDPKGNDVDFNSLKGRYVLIDFWASWCVPCRQSFPHMREVYRKYKSDRFEIYSISIDEDRKSWLKAVGEENNPWLQSLDTKNISQSGFAVSGVPSTFLIDPEGKILVKEVGFDPGGNSMIEKKLEELFGKKTGSETSSEKTNKPVMKAIPITPVGKN